MNVVFWFLVVLALVALWFLLSGYFKPLGEFILKLFNNAKSEIEDEEDESYECTMTFEDSTFNYYEERNDL